MTQQFKTGDLSKAFSATGIAFDGQTVTAKAATVDIRAEAREQEKALTEKTEKLDNDFARHTPAEGEEAGAPGRVGTGSAHAKAHEIIQQRKKGKELANFLTRLQEQRIEFERQINWTIHYFEQKAKEAAAQAGELRGKIVDNTERMIENSNFIREVEQLLNADKDGISIDKDKLRKLLKGQGADVDDNTPLPLLLQTAEKMVIEADEENAVLEIDNDIHDKAASKFEALVEGFETQAKNLKSKFEALKAQNLSEEDYKVAADKILEDVPDEVKDEYENRHGDNTMDEIAKKDLKSVEKKEVSLDPMAMMGAKPQAQIENKMNETTIQPPSPNGM